MKALLLFIGLLPFSLLAQTTIIKNINLIDVENRKLVKNTSVQITEGTITKIAPFKKMKISAADSLVEGNGRYLMPGLIDAHIHFFQSGGLYTRPDAENFTEETSYEEEIEFNKANANDYLKRYLQRGITTVMDVGGPMYNFTIRDSVAKADVAPNVLVTGPLFSMVARPQLDKGDAPIIQVSTKEEVLALFNKQLPYKPDFIKVWYVVTPELPAEKSYPLVEYLGQLCRENNLQLAVHATQLNTAQLAVKAGATILVHSVDDQPVPDMFVQELKKKGATYIPTLTVTNGYIKTFTGQITHATEDLSWANPAAYGSLFDLNKIDQSRWSERLKGLYGKDPSGFFEYKDSVMAVNLKRLSEAGVNIATGTDAGNIGTMHASSYKAELMAMQKADLSKWDILVCSTLNPAKGFGRGDKLGSISKGKQADMVLLAGNPLEDLEQISKVDLVVRGGKVLEPKLILEESPEQVVQRQVNAYNARDIEAFLATYAEDVKVYNENQELIMDGQEAMRKSYFRMFAAVPNLYCEIENRILINNKVIDKEKVRFNERTVHAVAVYTVENGLISEVRFVE